MPFYYINNNAQSNGDHEVHQEGCAWLPQQENRSRLGYHSTCKSAVQKAKEYHSQVNGCYHCSKECHTS